MVNLVSPARVTDFLLVESRERGEVLTNLKLQKLIYYAQAWYLALRSAPIFDEDMQAWVHGPVLPSQYHRFSHFKWQPIVAEIGHPEIGDADVQSHLFEIIEVFGTETAVDLERMTHQEAPWIEARNGLARDAICTNVISKDSMRDYYRSLSDQEVAA
jgi:uncharacterized phage-associated protein